MWDTQWRDRGTPAEHDPGPAAAGGWAELFAQTPDYRSLGVAALGREAFRWHFGPMFYRGRLADGAVSVLVVGQEGAQDESLAHRGFVGGTGSRLQHLLRFLGITRSYLFLNTFVYPIFGQYGQPLRPLAQGPGSPIVQHRHELFERVAATGPLRLVIAVGTAAQEAVATWNAMRGGSLPPRVRTVHVVHPGAAAAGSGAQVRASFARAAEQIGRWVRDDPTWLPADPGAARDLTRPYVLGSAPVPFADLPFGVPWRLGSGGTTSNRRDNQAGIQLFSADGRYDNRGATLAYAGDAAGSRDGYADEPGDLPYEPPKVDFGQFDRGPGPLARLLAGREPGLDWPDFAALGLPGHPSFGFGPAYRGRLDDPSLVVLADQDGHDDLFTGRAMSGDAGQRLQALLAAAGLDRSYAVLRVLPVDSLTATAARRRAAVDDPAVQRMHRSVLGRMAGPRALLAVGPQARRLAPRIAPAGLPVIAMKATAEPQWQADWQRALDTLSTVSYPRDGPASFRYDGGRGQIERADLPYGTVRWQGTSGDRVVRPDADGTPSPDYVKVMMPRWARTLQPG